MRQYEVTFIVDPVLSTEEINSTAQNYVEMLQSQGCEIVHSNRMGLQQLAYPINKRTTGIYYCVEYKCINGEPISKVELALRRDERIMRFLTVALDKFGVKYNEDKRNGLIGKKRPKKEDADTTKKADSRPAAEKAAPAKAETVKVEPKKAEPVVAAAAAKPVIAASEEE